MTLNLEKITQFASPKVIIKSENFQYNFYSETESEVEDKSFNSLESKGNISTSISRGEYVQVPPRKLSLTLSLKNLKDFNQKFKTAKSDLLVRNNGLQRRLNNFNEKLFIFDENLRKQNFNEKINLNKKFYEENSIDLTFDEDLSFMYNALVEALDTEEPNDFVSNSENNEMFLSYSQKMESYKSDAGIDLREKQKLGSVSTKNIEFLDRINKANGNSFKGFLDDKNLLSSKNYNDNIFIQKAETKLEEAVYDSLNKTKKVEFINPKTLFKTAEYLSRITKTDTYQYSVGLVVGILIDKYLVNDDLSKTYLCSKFKKFDSSLDQVVIEDEALRYSSKYIYEVKPVHMFLRNRFQNNLDFHEFYLVLGNKTSSNIVHIIERQSPDVPTSLLCRYNFSKKGIELNWGMPNNPQNDIFNFQVFRRESILEPFKLIKEIRGKNVSVQADEGFEEPLDTVIDNSGTKFYFTDTEVTHDKIYIYAICAVDVHGMSSALSMQVACKFNRLLSSLDTDTISLAGALKFYPNQFIPRKTKFFDNENSVINNTPLIKNKSKFKLYFTPDYSTIINKNNTYEIIKFARNQNHASGSDSHYTINLTDLDTLEYASQKIYIKR